jgi:hypothetical protein
LWLPPKVWFHGSQSTITGGSSAMKASEARSISWLLHSIRCVLMTPLGAPVEPEVNRIFATVSGPTPAAAASTAAVGAVLASVSNAVVGRSFGAASATTTSASAGTVAAMAAAKAWPFSANTRPGRRSLII